MQAEESSPDSDLDELSWTTITVLCLLGALVVGAFLKFIVDLIRDLKPREHYNGPDITFSQKSSSTVGEAKKATPVPETAPVIVPQKPGKSLKQLVKNAQHASSRQVASDKPVDHPLYLNSIRACHDSITGISFSEDGKSLAVACEDRVLRVFSIDDLRAKHFSFKRKELLRDLIDVACGAGGDLFVLTKGGMEPAVIEKYNFTAGSAKGSGFTLAWEAKSIHGQETGKGLRAAFTPHSSRKSLVISYTAKTDVQVFSDTGSQLAAVNISGLQNHDLAFARSGRFFGAATFTTDVRLYEVQYTREGEFRKAAKVMDLKKAHNGQVLALSFSPEGSRIVTASKDGTWAVWNIDVRYAQDEDPKILLKTEQETEGGQRYQSLAFGPDNIIAASHGSTLHFLDAKRGTVLEQIEDAHEGPITSLQWSPLPHDLGSSKTALLATSSTDKRIRLWRAPLV